MVRPFWLLLSWSYVFLLLLCWWWCLIHEFAGAEKNIWFVKPHFLNKTRHMSNATSEVCEANSGILLSLKIGCRLTITTVEILKWLRLGLILDFVNCDWHVKKLISASVSKIWMYTLKILCLVHFTLPRVMITFKGAAVKI